MTPTRTSTWEEGIEARLLESMMRQYLVVSPFQPIEQFLIEMGERSCGSAALGIWAAGNLNSLRDSGLLSVSLTRLCRCAVARLARF